MTMPAFAAELGARLPSNVERAAANQLRQILAAGTTLDHGQKLKVLDASNEVAEIILTPALSRLLMTLLRHIDNGDAVTLVPLHQMLTTQQAADILNVSRPYLIGVLERGEIAHTMVGRHRRIRAEDLFSYKRARDSERGAALTELAATDADLL